MGKGRGGGVEGGDGISNEWGVSEQSEQRKEVGGCGRW